LKFIFFMVRVVSLVRKENQLTYKGDYSNIEKSLKNTKNRILI